MQDVSDELLEYLGNLFERHKFYAIYGLTFTQFIEGWQVGYWREWQ